MTTAMTPLTTNRVVLLTDERIAAHRICWGWFGTEMLITNAVHDTHAS
jgi:hypothetical protein